MTVKVDLAWCRNRIIELEKRLALAERRLKPFAELEDNVNLGGGVEVPREIVLYDIRAAKKYFQEQP